MSSSSTTACSRSPSPAPTTPDASDSLEPVMSQEELSAWCKSLPNAEFLLSSGIQLAEHARKAEDNPALSLDDLLQDHVYEDATPAALDVSLESMFCPVTSPSSPDTTMSNGIVSPQPSIASTKPIPPPAQIRKDPPAVQRVVFPEKQSCSNLPIMFPGLPESGTKSRVETQIRLTVDLAHASASSGEPLKYDKVGSWKWLRLPKGTTTKKRTRKEGKVDAPVEDSLYLTAEITCATPPHTRVTVCSSCQTREAKRVARKIAARVRPARSDSESQEEPRVIPGKGRHEDTSNILQFNCPEVLDFSSGSVILPLRITCYCRHHREKVGFNLHLAMLDHAGRVVGTGTTKPIMITDDHKSTGLNSQKSTTEFGSKLDWTVNGTESPEAAPKRKKAVGVERAKKRAKPYDANNRVSRLQRQSSSGSLQSPSEMTSAFATRPSSPQQNPTAPSLQIVTSVVSPSPSAHSVIEQPPSSTSYPPEQLPHCPSAYDFSEHNIGSPYTVHQHTASSPPYHLDEQPTHVVPAHPQDALDSSVSTAVASPMASTYSVTIADIMASRYNMDVPMPDCADLSHPPVSFPDPSGSTYIPPQVQPMPPPVVEPMDLSMSQAPTAMPMPYMLFKHDPPPPMTLPLPRIHRLIPAVGPTFGGIEVTVLGANFHPTMQLNCVFGSTVSTSTQRWSDNTLVCLLPPSPTPGQVHVWFEGLPKEEDGTPPCLFTYTDETDRALMELALQVVGLKMTGKIEDARHIAMRIVGNTGGPEPDAGMSPGGGGGGGVPGGAMQLSSRLLRGRTGDSADFEQTLLDFLSVLDVPLTVTSSTTSSTVSSISKQTSSGQTLLHLAVLAQFPALVRFLLVRGIDIDARDNNGCTAVFLAALVDSVECSRALVEAGAALDVVNAAGKTPAEVGPAGFFDFIATSESDRSSEADADDEDDEGAWGDVDEESDMEVEPRRAVLRRRATCKTSRRRLKPRSSTARSAPPPPPPEKSSPELHAKVMPSPTTPALSSEASEKKALEAAANAVDEKQVAATFTETLYRTLAQLQHPQGMIPNLPPLQNMQNMLHMNVPALFGALPVPAWGALPQLPATVFPVLVPIQQLWGARALRGPAEGEGASEPATEGEGEGQKEAKESGEQSRMWTVQDWRAFWEKLMLQATQAQQQQTSREHDGAPPPAYTPRSTDTADAFPTDRKVAEPEPVEVSADVGDLSRAQQKKPALHEVDGGNELRERAVSRRVGYGDVVVPEVEVQQYGYRSTRKPARRAQKKHDRMLILFWIPILIIGITWAFLHSIRIALHATRTLVSYKVGVQA